MTLNYDDIAEILKIIDGSSCDELIVETGDMKLVIRRNAAGGGHTASHESATGSIAVASAAAPSVVPAQAPAAKAAAKASHQIEVTAPMVGTFYRAPSPDAPPFVEVGSVVRKGQPLCLIEVMKLFTSVRAGTAGVIREICVDDAEMVEYGQTLFYIEPA